MTEEFVLLECITDNPYQPRTTDNAEHIESLARSIAADGLLQKPTARHTVANAQLAFGHSRRKAFEWLKSNWQKEGLPERYNGYTGMPLNIEELNDEDMYRQAISENVQRKDLDAIELAKSMVVYRDEFHKTSDEIGTLFSMSGATVRGKLMLLELPTVVQEKLAVGEISEGTARSMRSMQKVASDEVIQKTLEAVIVGKDRWGEDVPPDNLIAEAIEELANVQEFWYDTRGDKPRAGGSDGWLIDMKNFPNKLLPDLAELSVVEFVELLQITDEASKKIISVWMHNHNEFDQSAWDELDASELDRKLVERIKHLANPSSCSACPFYTKLKGTHYCGDKTCYFRKTSAWERHGLQAASKKLGIEIYAEEDGDYLVLEDTYQNSQHAELYKKKNKDLRFAFMADIDRKKYQSGYDGCPKSSVVVVVGETLKKLLVKKQETKQTKQKDPDKLHRDLFDKKADVLLWESTLYLKAILDGVPDDAVEGLFNAPRYGWPNLSAVPEIETQDAAELAVYGRREIVLHILLNNENGISADEDGTLADFAGEIVSRAKDWKIKIPTAFMKLAEQMDAEITSAVSVETPKK